MAPHKHSLPLTREDRFDIARATVKTLKSCSLMCCLFGSAACALYGTSRDPRDVDVIVLTKLRSTVEIKEMIVERNSSFFLKDARKRDADYQVLYYQIPNSSKRPCKIDILIPGPDLRIPYIPRQKIRWIHGIPMLPLAALVPMKLQGWDDRRTEPVYWRCKKQWDDVDDLVELVDIAAEQGVWITRQHHNWLPAWFMNAAKERAKRFNRALPDRNVRWEDIGLA